MNYKENENSESPEVKMARVSANKENESHKIANHPYEEKRE
jgi:hypothetical protein